MSSNKESGRPEEQRSSPAPQAEGRPDHEPVVESGQEPEASEFLSDLELGLDGVVDAHMRSLMPADNDGIATSSAPEASPEGSGVLARPSRQTSLAPSSTNRLQQGGQCAVLVAPGAGALYFELGESSLVGRSDGCKVQVSSSAVSLEHARIDRELDGYWLRDLGSTNGTRLNGRLVEGPSKLADGDQLVFADTLLVFLTGLNGPAAARTAQLPPVNQLQPWVPAPAGMVAPDNMPAPSFAEQLEKVFRVLRLLQRHWRLLTISTVLGGVLGYAAVLVSPPATVAEFEMAITPAPPRNPLESQRYVPQEYRQEQQFYQQAHRAFVNAKLVRTTLQRLGEHEPGPERVVSISRRLQLAQRESAHAGQFSDVDADFSIRFLTQHVDNFVKTEIEKTVRELQSEVDFLSNTVKEKDDQLRRTEGELRDFKRQHMLHLPEYAGGRLAGAAELEGRRAELSTRVTRLSAELDLAKQRFARESPLVESKVAESQPYRAGLTDVNRRMADAKARGLSEGHPEMQQLRREYAELERRADNTARGPATELDRQANPEYTRLKDRVADIQVELGAAQNELGELGGQLGKIDETVKAMPEAEANFARLSRSYETDKAMHARVLERLRQAEIQLELERSNARARYEILTAPHSLGINLRKAIGLRAGAGLVLGLMVALGIALFLELRAYLRRMPLVRVSPSGRVVQVIAPSPDHPALPGR